MKTNKVTTANLTVTATSTQGAGASTTQETCADREPVAPALTAPNSLSVKEDGTVALGIGETAFDSRDVVIDDDCRRTELGPALSAGTKNSDGSWTLSPEVRLSG